MANTVAQKDFPRVLSDGLGWNMVPLSCEGAFAALNEDSTFLLYPFVQGDELDVRPAGGWLKVGVRSFDYDKCIVTFRIFQNTLPGVSYQSRKGVCGFIGDMSNISQDLIIFDKVEGLTFDGKTRVFWVDDGNVISEDEEVPSLVDSEGGDWEDNEDEELRGFCAS